MENALFVQTLISKNFDFQVDYIFFNANHYLANYSVMITESQFFAFMFCVSLPLLGLLMSKSPARRFREETSLTRCSLLFWWSYVANSWKAVPSSVLYQRFIGIQVSIIQCSSIAEEKNKNSAKYHKR